MWRLYLKSDEGVAIRSTYGRLKESFGDASQAVSAGKIVYIEYETDPIPRDNALVPFLYKRMSFEHEHEVRAIYWNITELQPQLQAEFEGRWVEPARKGVDIPANLDTLIESVYVSPTKEDWFYELVKTTLAKYGHKDKETKKSRLAEDPIW
jgi:hypothetical protein